MTGPFFWTEFRGVLLQSETAATEGGLSGLTQAIHGRSYAVPDGAAPSLCVWDVLLPRSGIFCTLGVFDKLGSGESVREVRMKVGE